MQRKLTGIALALVVLVSSVPVLAHEQADSDVSASASLEMQERNKKGDGSLVEGDSDEAEAAQKQWHPTDFVFVIDGV